MISVGFTTAGFAGDERATNPNTGGASRSLANERDPEDAGPRKILSPSPSPLLAPRSRTEISVSTAA
jgi:hypothetical protein